MPGFLVTKSYGIEFFSVEAPPATPSPPKLHTPHGGGYFMWDSKSAGLNLRNSTMVHYACFGFC